MEAQLITHSPAISTNTTPYTTAPSSPHRFPNFFYSAPTSPVHTTFQQDDDDFSFDFSGHLEPPSISAADDLFHAGKIKTLNHSSSNDLPKTKFDSFTSTFHQTPQNPPKRGRETTTGATRPRGKVSRSSSPFRISDILSDQDTDQKHSLTWYNKWNFKNLLLFRSTSEGSARRRNDLVNRYSRITTVDEDVKSSSFRSTDGSSARRVMRKVSAHEMHYTVNRAAAEEMRRKTSLPYKSGLLGCLGFYNNGAGGVYEVSRGVASVMKQV